MAGANPRESRTNRNLRQATTDPEPASAEIDYPKATYLLKPVRTAAVLRSFVTCCELVKIDPFAWFRDALSRIADHPVKRLEELLPHQWAMATR
jgi:hypothetical protein